MKESELLKKAISHYENKDGKKWVVWKAPAFAQHRWDIFTIYDLVAVSEEGAVHFIQVTTKPNLSARRKKIQAFFIANALIIPHSYIFAWDNRLEYFKISEILL